MPQKRTTTTKAAIAGERAADATPTSVTLELNTETTERWFGSSRVESLRKLETTEHGLFSEALRVSPAMTIEQLLRDGAHVYAKRLISLANSPATKKNPRRKGVANKRIARIYNKIQADNVKAREAGASERSVTASTLAVRAKTNIATAQRFLEEQESSIIDADPI